MKFIPSLIHPERRFAVVIGLTDGILTALTLGSGTLFTASKLSVDLCLRIAVASSLSGMFVFFTAEYSRIRGDLVRASRQLNLASRGHLATTQLGRIVRRDAIRAALVSSACNFLGAAFPLIVGVAVPAIAWLPIAAAIVALGILGVALARTVYGNVLRWSVALMFSGVFLAFVGIEIHVV